MPRSDSVENTLNIWYLSAHDQPRGRSSRTYDFARELYKKGHRVTMFTNSLCHWTHEDCLTSEEKWRIEEVDGIRVVWLKTLPYQGNGVRRGLNMISNAWRSLQVASVLADTPDVVIGPSVPLGTGWAAMKIALRKKAGFVFEVRDVWPIALVDDGGMSKRNPVYAVFRLMEKVLYRRADRISSAMPYLTEHVAQSGADPGKIVWIPNGAALDRFQGYDHYTGGKNGKLVVMYVGGFGQAHDVITIVHAAAILRNQGQEGFRFVIIGNGPKKPACIQEAERLGLKNIEFRPPVSKSEVPRVQTESDVLVACVLDSPIYRFGLNLNKMYDYFASARPVLFSGVSRNDPVRESGAGFSIPPEDPEAMAQALVKLLRMNQEHRVEMGRRGRDYVARDYTMSILGGKMEQMLRDVVNLKRMRTGEDGRA